MQEDGRTDGWTCACRCLAAMAGERDAPTRRSLWRAAVKYARKDVEPGRRLEIAPPGLPHALELGS